tara:strand:+ start:22032 stop:22961 length:930 start_codon:yes stop_codon:yes gene_type:complete
MAYLKSFRRKFPILVMYGLLLTSLPAYADQSKGRLIKKVMEKRAQNKNSDSGSTKGLYQKGAGQSQQGSINRRSFIVYTPPAPFVAKNRPLLVVLHGGMGNAEQIQNYIGLEPLADKHGFIVVYLNGTKVSRITSGKRGGWNAGGCCGLPEKNKVDDIGYINKLIDYMHRQYGIDPKHVYGTGHSNGGMMTQRIMCETQLYKSAVSLSGTLQLERQSCPQAKGRHIMNIHGVEDFNLPVRGGYTVKGINKKTNYKSQEYTQGVFERSGAVYDVVLLEGADHSPESLNAALWAQEGISLPQKIVSYLELD